jgi:hypothetical protein
MANELELGIKGKSRQPCSMPSIKFSEKYPASSLYHTPGTANGLENRNKSEDIILCGVEKLQL